VRVRECGSGVVGTRRGRESSLRWLSAAMTPWMVGLGLLVSFTADAGTENAIGASRLGVIDAETVPPLPPGTLLNVNIPACTAGKIKGVCITRQSRTLFKDRFDKRTDPRGQTYYWLTGSLDQKDAAPDSDVTAVNSGRISITPLQFDLTDYKFVTELENWEF